MVDAEPESYDFAVFGVLAYEFAGDELKEAEQKIRRKLRRQKLGAYDQQKVDVLRDLKNSLQREFGLQTKSAFYVGSNLPHVGAVQDFDQQRMTAELAARYPAVSTHDLGRMVSLAIYLYYLR